VESAAARHKLADEKNKVYGVDHEGKVLNWGCGVAPPQSGVRKRFEFWRINIFSVLGYSYITSTKVLD
jgi:hypothetical protein